MGSNKGKNLASQPKSRVIAQDFCKCSNTIKLPILISIHANELKGSKHTDETAQIAKILQFFRMLPSSLKVNKKINPFLHT